MPLFDEIFDVFSRNVLEVVPLELLDVGLDRLQRLLVLVVGEQPVDVVVLCKDEERE